MMRHFIQYILYSPVWIIYRLCSNKFIREEEKIWCDKQRVNHGSEFKNFIFLMTLAEYRSVLYWRLGLRALLINKIIPPHRNLYITTASERVKKGFVINHGHSTIIHANSIGENCQIWQNVTIGKVKPGGPKPVIGNNVLIYTGAVVIGDITIGDNVKIGANSVVTKSVPNNCTVAGNPAIIIRRNGKRVSEKL